MALQTFVKVNHITNLSDARYCSGMYVNLLGFDLVFSSENYVTPERFKEITGWISGVEYVAEFSHPTILDLEFLEKDYPGITWIEHDRIDDLKRIVGKGYQLIYKMNLEEVKHIEPEVSAELHQSGIIFNVIAKDGELTEDDLEVVKKLSANCKVILGSGITAENVLRMIKECNLYGISIPGGEEIKPGLSEFELQAEILEKLELAG
jgi:phosphoribosylanthranilate isomerase